MDDSDTIRPHTGPYSWTVQSRSPDHHHPCPGPCHCSAAAAAACWYRLRRTARVRPDSPGTTTSVPRPRSVYHLETRLTIVVDDTGVAVVAGMLSSSSSADDAAADDAAADDPAG